MTPQPLPACWKYPGRECPGECQYILPAGECLNDRPMRVAA
jgi:hypothetical protein